MSFLDVAVASPTRDEILATDHAMATRITINVPVSAQLVGNRAGIDDAISAAKQVFHIVDETCTRFDATSPLMLANRSPKRWHRVPDTLFKAIEEAKRAHDVTDGRFDPRVLSTLVALGYDKTLPFGERDVLLRGLRPTSSSSRPGSWRPRLRYGTHEVLLGDEPIDLGGIGKGLAVRWASEILAQGTRDFLIEAGGDCYCAGFARDGEPWRIGVEDPSGKGEPICVLSLHDRAVTTSSIRLRRWVVDGKSVHHLIDPTTRRPGGRGLVAVTVVGEDPARSEVWSKALFISGKRGIAALSERRSIPALWIDELGNLTTSTAIERYVQWRGR